MTDIITGNSFEQGSVNNNPDWGYGDDIEYIFISHPDLI